MMATQNKSKKLISANTQSKTNMTEKGNTSKPATVVKKKAATASKKQKKKPVSQTKRPKKKQLTSKGPKKKPVSQTKKAYSMTTGKPAITKKKKAYSMMGELTITTSAVPPIKAPEKTFRTPEIVVDNAGSMFHKTSLELMVDNRRSIAVLDAEQVEILLKLIRIADYAE